MRRTPRPKAVWRVYAITLAFACLAAVGTWLTDGNYMFLRHKPARGSLLDFMGPWPVYILVTALLALVMFVALAALARPISARSRSSTIALG
jgi:uncharacterized membrane protein YwaF